MLLGHAGVDANQARVDDGRTPLFIACHNGHAKVVRMLLGAGAHADLAVMHGGPFACVVTAQMNGHAEVVALLKGGAAALYKVGARVEVRGL
jgi:ankyrin repeat protein